MPSPVLWKNAEDTIFLIDIPRSIEAAQGNVDFPNTKRILSSPPQAEPFATYEPKTEAARERVAQKLVVPTGDSNDSCQSILEDALQVIRHEHDGSWCLPRLSAPDQAISGHKRRQGSRGCQNPDELDAMLSTVAYHGSCGLELSLYSAVTENTQDCHRTLTSSTSPCNPDDMIRSECDGTSILNIRQSGRSEQSFLLPPNSAFCCSDCSRSTDFRAALRANSNDHNGPRKFDLILLDPPWPNRSVKRTHKTPNSTYSTQATVNGVGQLLLGMDLDTLLKYHAFLAIWITNKPAIRQLLLEEGGIFDALGLTLVEEWLWLKVTSTGEPILPLHSIWRKPYEICLIARKIDLVPQSSSSALNPGVKRKVIVAVPDIHSRKPCLKDMLKPLLPQSYDGLEIFARHLVADWYSWGDQCIKFNWKGYWQDSD